ncbi:uncharacterized protein [Prorops nasuta]|uniref:uncharacterized protein n=1 Tax=Prorops nasuta TaxID=863751 RepID=UPI0034CD5888
MDKASFKILSFERNYCSWEWSDDKLEKLDNALAFTEEVSLEIKKLIIHRFFQLYFNGTSDPIEDPFVIIANAISLAPANTSFKEYERLFSDKGAANDAKPICSVGLLSSKLKMYTIQTEDLNSSEFANDEIFLSFTKADQKTFSEKIFKILLDKNTDYNETLHYLLRLTSFLALSTLRALAKKKSTFSLTYFRKTFINNTFSHGSCYFEYAPPCNRFYSVCRKTLHRKNKNASNLFIKILHRYMQEIMCVHTLPTDRSMYVRSMFGASCMKSLEFNGLHLIKPVFDAKKCLSLGCVELSEYTHSEETKESWDRFFKLMRRFSNNSSQGVSIIWSRLVDPIYFSDISGKHNLYLCGILNGIIEKILEKPSVWNANWCYGKKQVLYKARKAGHELVEDWKEKRDKQLRKDIERIFGKRGKCKFNPSINGDEMDNLREVLDQLDI